MKWMIMAAVTLTLLFGCVFMVINKQKELDVIADQVQTYIGQRDKLQKEVGDLQGHRDLRAALDKEWAEFKNKEGELKGKYGDKLVLEGECAKLTEKRDSLATSIKTMEARVSSLQGRVAELVVQTNILGKAMDRMRGERDDILLDIEREKKTQDKVRELREAEKTRYDNQKRLADHESERAEREKSRADVAKRDADDAERRREDAERTEKAAVAAQKTRVDALRTETDKEIAAQEKRSSAAGKAASEAKAKVEAEEAKLKVLAEEVAKLQARRDELVGVEKQLNETKAALAVEREKLGQAMERVTARQIAAQIDDVRNDVSQRLGIFKAKLDEFEKRQNEKVKQGGLE